MYTNRSYEGQLTVFHEAKVCKWCADPIWVSEFAGELGACTPTLFSRLNQQSVASLPPPLELHPHLGGDLAIFQGQIFDY